MLRLQFIGYLGHDAHTRHVVKSNQDAITFSVAVTERWKKDGVQQEKTIWINCTLWRPAGSSDGQWLKKGRLVYVEGEPSVKAWLRPGDNVPSAVQECRVTSYELLSGKSGAAEEPDPDQKF